MDFVYGLIDLVGVAICFICCVITMFGDASRNQKNLLMTYVSGLIIAIGNAMEYFAESYDVALTSVKFGYLGKAFLMIFILQFVAGFSTIKISALFLRILCVFNLFILGSVMTCDKHNLYYSSIEPKVLESGRFVLVYGKGIYISFGCYSFWLVSFSSGERLFMNYSEHRKSIRNNAFDCCF